MAGGRATLSLAVALRRMLHSSGLLEDTVKWRSTIAVVCVVLGFVGLLMMIFLRSQDGLNAYFIIAAGLVLTGMLGGVVGFLKREHQ